MFPIKCKAWHEGANKMFSAEEMGQDELTINPDGRGFVNVSNDYHGLYSSEYYSNMIPLQFIGLIDIDGNEIYQSDIVSFTKTYNNESYIGIVGYCIEVAGFMINALNNESWGSTEFGLGTVDLKVLGNKYENPELMETYI